MTAIINNQHTSHKLELANTDALLVIDIQNDFLHGGRLAIPDGNQVIPVLNEYIERFTNFQLPVFATRDWHPPNHYSFIQQGGPWPEHCIAGSEGAEFAGDLHLPEATCIISKGTDINTDGYSGFANQALKERLDIASVCRLFIGGLATDYCVLNTVRDALKYHYKVMLLTDAIRAVNICKQDGENAINEMIQKGAVPITLAALI